MTVSTAYAPITAVGNDTIPAIAIAWPFFTGTLVVTEIASTGVETVKALTTHYTVAGGTDSDGLPASGTVTPTAAIATGKTWRITRVTPKTQASTWSENDAFSAKTIEAMADRLTLIAQEGAGAAADDITGDVMTLNTAGATDYWDAESHVIRGVADAVESTDAVNYGQLQSVLVDAGSGDVVGPASSTNGAIAKFSGTSGNLLAEAVAGTDYAAATVTQTGTGATSRTVVAKLRERFTPEDFGAVGDGTTNDSAAFQAAFTAMIAAGGGVLDLGAKTYRITTNISIPTITAAECITVRGCGSATVLDFSGSITAGLAFTSSSTVVNIRPRISINDIKIQTSKQNAGTAIAVSYANNTYAHDSVRITGVEIIQTHTRLSDSGSDYGYWTKGIVLTNCRDATLSEWSFTGEMDLSPDTSAGVELLGECTGVRILGAHILEATTGIHITDTCEGVYISDTEIVYCVYGIRYNVTSGVEPVLSVTNCHINASTAGIYATNVMFLSAANTSFFAAAALNSGTWPTWYGVLLDGANAKQAQITGCSFTKESGRTGDTTTGVQFSTGSAYRITGNNFYGLSGNSLTYGVVLSSGVNDVSITGNGYVDVTVPRSMSGATNIVVHERLHVVQQEVLTLANGANSNVVLIDGVFQRVTGPTGSFSISGFVAPVGCMEIVVYNPTSQNMTITNDATSTAANRIYTLTGADVALTGTSVARFIYSPSDSRWILISTQG